jgi:glycosyltransferase involved in cell wall biosynthesis
MKILFFDTALPYLLKDANYPVGGWAVELSNWIAGLQAAGAEVEVLTWRGANEYVGHPVGVHLRESYRPEGGIRILKYFYHHIPAIVAATRAARPDIVIQACSGLETGIMAFAAAQAGVPFVHRLASDCDVDDRIKMVTRRGYARVAYRWGMARAAAVLCQNSYQAGAARQRWPDLPQLLVYNPLSVPSGWHDLGRGGRSYVAWLANFGPAKNLPLLARVAAANPGIRFRVAGGMSGIATDEIRLAVEQLRGTPNVDLVGYLRRDEVPQFLAGAKCLLTTSHVEGFSNTFLEAFAVGTPIIAPQRVDPDGVIGRLRLGVVARDDEALMQVPAQVFALPADDYVELSERCRAYVLGAHDPRRLAQDLIRFLRTLTPRSGAVSLSDGSLEHPSGRGIGVSQPGDLP